jgi:hypothetical protein
LINDVNDYLQIVKDMHMSVYTSFDFVDRFQSKDEIQRFEMNLQILKNNDIDVRIDTLIINPNIDYLMYKKGDAMLHRWEELYKTYRCDFIFWQDTGDIQYKVTQQKLEQFIVFLLTYYPNVGIIKSLKAVVDGHRRDFDCIDCIGIDGPMVKYRRCTATERSRALQNFVNNKRCLCCEYYANCGRKCWCEHADDTSPCWIRKCLDLIKYGKCQLHQNL